MPLNSHPPELSPHFRCLILLPSYPKRDYTWKKFYSFHFLPYLHLIYMVIYIYIYIYICIYYDSHNSHIFIHLSKYTKISYMVVYKCTYNVYIHASIITNRIPYRRQHHVWLIIYKYLTNRKTQNAHTYPKISLGVINIQSINTVELNYINMWSYIISVWMP